MTEQQKKEMFNLVDMIRGEINRICVTDDLAELDTMALYARNNITRLQNLRFNADFKDKEYTSCKKTCGDCKNFSTVNCSETYREPTINDDVCEDFKDKVVSE